MIIETIRDNVTGSVQFFAWLFGLWRKAPFSPICPTETDGSRDKYSQLLKQSSVPLLPAEPRFCPTCHALVAYTRQTKEGTQIIQNGRVLLTIRDVAVTNKDGRKVKGSPFSCPNRHEVIL